MSTLMLAMIAGPALDTPQGAERPNVVVIIADDLGFSDLGCYGSEIATPTLDALAAGGVRLTQFYNTGRCWPTRSALMTGYYPQQIRRDGLPGAPARFEGRPFGGRGQRPSWAPLVSTQLQAAGYRTYHSGKWHIDGDPLRNGFDRSDQTRRGHGFFETIKNADRDPGYYETIDTADHAVACLKEHAASYGGQPFFQYVAFRAPHFPLHALPEDIARYRDRYAGGWEVLRRKRHRRQQERGLTIAELSAIETQVGPPYHFPDSLAQLGAGEVNRPVAWASLSQPQQRFQATKMAIHAAMIDRMDREIGRIVGQLRTMDALDRTLVCFLSDNGASAEIMVRGDGHDPDAAPGSASTYLCLGPGFSSAANTPLRRHKTWVHEGGISTPMIVHWPAGGVAGGAIRTGVGHVVDLAPAILAMTGTTVSDRGGPPSPGRNLVGVLKGEDTTGREQTWWCHEGNHALRQGDWKIVRGDQGRPFPYQAAGQPGDFGDWSLYDLASDRAEQHDLAAAQPKRVQAMADRWDELRREFLADATGR